MAQLKALVIAFVVGTVIVCLAILLTGFVAAIPISAAYLEPLRTRIGLSTLLTSLLAQIPVAIAAAAVSWLMFRALGRSSRSMVAACIAPWLLLVLAEWFTDFARVASSLQNPYLALATVTGALCVPLGVWLAARICRGPRAGQSTRTGWSLLP